MMIVEESPRAEVVAPPSEHTLTLRDGVNLFYRAWLPERPATKALLLFHRGHEHSGRWRETVAALGLQDTAVFAWDQRGHGRSPGERGSAPNLATVVRDTDEWARHVLASHGIVAENTVVLAHSLGAVIATAWVHDYAPPIRGLIMATPAFRVKLYVPLAVPFLRLRQKLLGPGYVKSFIRPGMLTHDPEQVVAYGADPQIFRQIAVNMLLDLHDTSTRLLDDAGAITAPLLVLAAGSDWVVNESAQRHFVARAGSAVKRFEGLPGLSHSIFHEKERQLVVDKVRDFINECFAQPALSFPRYSYDEGLGVSPSVSPLPLHSGGEGPGVRGMKSPVQTDRTSIATDSLRASTTPHPQPLSPEYRGEGSNSALLDLDRHGFTRDEYDRLCRPGGWRFAPVRWLMKGPGRLSRGIHLGWKHGFDSGVMLDYIYENRAQGITPLGWLIDRGFLNAIGWRGIRVRRELLEQALRTAIEQTHAAGRPVRLLDIASGPGRYVLETMSKLRAIPMSGVLRDCKQENLDAATRLRDQLGLKDVTICHGDAFDRESLASVTPRPTIAMVSGLYELFPENEPVLRSLHGLADAVEPGGYLLYTNQPWHPQLEFIARTLINREGKPWIMRRRTQAEMDALVRAVGFEKIAQEIDPWGIFTVAVARRFGR